MEGGVVSFLFHNLTSLLRVTGEKLFRLHVLLGSF